MPKYPVPKDPILLAGLREYLPRSVSRLVQKISRTKTGIALWPFRGAKAARALHDELVTIETVYQAQFEDVIVERAERWHTRVIDQLPHVTL